ncbi:unnamed protein product, partial [Ceratitis capitata]
MLTQLTNNNNKTTDHSKPTNNNQPTLSKKERNGTGIGRSCHLYIAALLINIHY